MDWQQRQTDFLRIPVHVGAMSASLHTSRGSDLVAMLLPGNHRSHLKQPEVIGACWEG